MTGRLEAQFAFLNEADRLKSISRANLLLDGSRPENSAEHSWHVALWALVHASSVPAADPARVIAMLLLHDIVEIDAGDTPIHLCRPDQAAAEAAAAERIFALLPDDQAASLHALWQEFEAGRSADAQLAKTIDHSQPLFQVLCASRPPADHLAIVRENLASGRAADLGTRWPEAHGCIHALLAGEPAPTCAFTACLAFLAEADRLKHVNRASTLGDRSRRENSAEHSWHIALYALILADQAAPGTDISRVIAMLLLHDLVEIDVGDVPIHSANGTAHNSAAIQEAECRAARRLFGLLPPEIGEPLLRLWQEFEANETPDAIFAKSLDRVQPVMQNIICKGGTWDEYNVTREQLETRVGSKIARGAPALWPWIRARALPFLAV